MTSHQHRLSTRSMASVAASNAVSNEDEEEAYSYVEDLSSLSDNVVIITTEASDDKDISNVHNRGRSVQGIILLLDRMHNVEITSFYSQYFFQKTL